jgi:hypothetical protein
MPEQSVNKIKVDENTMRVDISTTYTREEKNAQLADLQAAADAAAVKARERFAASIAELQEDLALMDS